ncbi:MAG: hypothetical protein JXB38_15045 [Anaerolineales bacterium]|nr:hypothetical protein [Anaerolineales bacterium]
MFKHTSRILAVLIFGLVFSACGALPGGPTPVPSITSQFDGGDSAAPPATESQSEVVVEASTSTPVPVAAEQAGAPTNTLQALLPTATLPPAATPTPAFSPTATPEFCDWAAYIEDVIVDVPVEQGTAVMPGTHFTKTWHVQNIGGCVWTPDYRLVWDSGNQFDAPDEIMLDQIALPGDTIDISISLVAPYDSGTHSGTWYLMNANGETFGYGEDADTPLPVTLQVHDLPGNIIYDFFKAHCLAEWHTGQASYLPCEGTADGKIGWVRTDNDPALEHRTAGNSTVLNVHPNNKDNGYIQGFFPPITIQDGYTFISTIGCMDEASRCSVMFQLNYELEDGTIGAVQEWPEKMDGQIKIVKADLSDLSGLTVRLILQVNQNDGRTANANVFWQNPRIEQE